MRGLAKQKVPDSECGKESPLSSSLAKDRQENNPRGNPRQHPLVSLDAHQ